MPTAKNVSVKVLLLACRSAIGFDEAVTCVCARETTVRVVLTCFNIQRIRWVSVRCAAFSSARDGWVLTWQCKCPVQLLVGGFACNFGGESSVRVRDSFSSHVKYMTIYMANCSSQLPKITRLSFLYFMVKIEVLLTLL